MELNPFIWGLYKESARGRHVLERCAHFEDALFDAEFDDVYFGDLSNARAEPPKNKDDKGESDSRLLIDVSRSFISPLQFSKIEEATRAFKKMVRNGLNIEYFGEKNSHQMITGEDLLVFMQQISIGLYLGQPEFFLPYGFVGSFDQLCQIARRFEIDIPQSPNKKNLDGRLEYYANLNEAFYGFRIRNGLNSVEMCAFLYDFALEFLEERDDLPEPSKAWLVTGAAYGPDDFDSLESATETTRYHWQGNLQTQRGDIIIMYVASPHSRIHSIWRATSNGFSDPFFPFHTTIWIGHPIKVSPVTFREMKAHPLLAKNGYMRAHLQGPSGKPFTAEEYSAILELLEKNGQDISILPRLPHIRFINIDELQNERDVEVKLIEPLLVKLGYSTKDWDRQLSVRMGRGERVYPDYAFGAKKTRGEESARMVLEAKYTLSRERDLREAYFQMRAYALRLQAHQAVLASREGVWVFMPKDGNFTFDRREHFSWDELEHPDSLNQLQRLIGERF